MAPAVAMGMRKSPQLLGLDRLGPALISAATDLPDPQKQGVLKSRPAQPWVDFTAGEKN